MAIICPGDIICVISAIKDYCARTLIEFTARNIYMVSVELKFVESRKVLSSDD